MKRSGVKRLAALMLGLAMLTVSACSTPAAVEPADRETPVQVDVVTTGDFKKENELIATARPVSEVNVVPKFSGELLRLAVSKGDTVQAGTRLADLNDRDLRRSIELERMSLELSRNQLEAARLSLRQVEDSVKSALREEGALLNEAEDRVRQATLQVEQAQISVRQTEVRLAQAEDRLQDSVVLSPISGEVTNIMAEPGELVGGGPLLTIAQIDPIKLEASVSSDQLSLLQTGQAFPLQLTSSGITLEGRIAYISPVATSSGLFNVEVQVPNPDKQIKAGMTAKLIVPETLVENALLVPTQAIIERGGSAYVYVINENTAIEKEIEILNSQTEHSAIRGDLTANDRVVVKGQLTLSDGNKVTIIEEGS